MTIMTRAEAREEKHYQQVADLIPDWRSLAIPILEDTLLPGELEDLGLEDNHDIAVHVESEVLERVDDARATVPEDARHFVDDEYTNAEVECYGFVMAELEDGDWEVPDL